MKTGIALFCLLLVVAFHLLGQPTIPRKLVEITSSNLDSTITSRIKRDKSGNIVELIQQVRYKLAICYQERYVKGKRWIVWTWPQSDSIMLTRQFKQDGLLEVSTYELAERRLPPELQDTFKSYEYLYYPNRQLKLKMEVRITQEIKGLLGTSTGWYPWNVAEYYYPDGKPFIDWGTLKDGDGYYNYLDDKGELCVPCTYHIKKRADEKARKAH